MDSPSQYIVTPESSMLEFNDEPSGSKVESPPIMSSEMTQEKSHNDGADRTKEQDIPGVTPINTRLPPLDGGASTSKLTTRDIPGVTPMNTRSPPLDGGASTSKPTTRDIPRVTPMKTRSPPMDGGASTSKQTTHDSEYIDASGPALIFLPSRPTKREWAGLKAASKTGIAMTGVAALGKVGTGVGLTDIGETDDSYIFRVALPGVKRDHSEFSCEVEPSGKVLIKGVTTTGEKSVNKFSQVFEMKTQNLCPPGHFSISFKLPDPVDPEKFSRHFGIDGILEGTVMKKKRSS